MMKTTNCYTDRLDQAIEAIEKAAADMQAEFVNTFWYEAICSGGIEYDTDRSVNVELASFRGRATRKYGHITIYRLETGRYEWNFYVL